MLAVPSSARQPAPSELENSCAVLTAVSNSMRDFSASSMPIQLLALHFAYAQERACFPNCLPGEAVCPVAGAIVLLCDSPASSLDHLRGPLR